MPASSLQCSKSLEKKGGCKPVQCYLQRGWELHQCIMQHLFLQASGISQKAWMAQLLRCILFHIRSFFVKPPDERQWLSAGYAWHSRPRTTTLSSNLRNAGAMSQDERRLFPVRRDLEHLTSKLPREPRDDPPRSLLAECSARYSFCLEESTAAMIFHEFLAPSARRVSHLCQRVDRTLERRVQRFRIQTAAAMITRHTNMSNARACFSL